MKHKMDFQKNTVGNNTKLIVGYMVYLFSTAVTCSLILNVLKASFDITGSFELVLSVTVIFTATLIATSIAIKLGLFGQRKRQ